MSREFGRILTVKAREVEGEGEDPKDLAVEASVLMITTQRVGDLEDRIKREFKELKDRQAQVRLLHQLLKAINASTDDKGKLDWSKDEELQKLLDMARELGVDIPEGKTKFSAEERLRLVENVKMTTEDLNLQNEMQLQTITRLTNERYESYQMARSIMRPLHEAKISMARKLAGRA